MNSRRRAAILLLVLVSLAMAVALLVPLATLAGASALDSNRHGESLRHRLATESLLAVLPELIKQDRRIALELDRDNRTYLSLELDGLLVEAILQDDTAKLPLTLVAGRHGRSPLRDAMGVLQTSLRLPGSLMLSSDGAGQDLPWTGTLDDLLAEPSDQDLFGISGTTCVWSGYLSPLGQTVHAFRAAPAVLEAALFDLQPGLGTRLAQARQEQVRPDLRSILARMELPQQVCQEVVRRLVVRTERYSLLVRTQAGNDARQRYIICTATSPVQILLDWEVAP